MLNEFVEAVIRIKNSALENQNAEIIKECDSILLNVVVQLAKQINEELKNG